MPVQAVLLLESKSIEDRIMSIEEEEEAERAKTMYKANKNGMKQTKRDLLREIQQAKNPQPECNSPSNYSMQ
jgi:hypothetical protein